MVIVYILAVIGGITLLGVAGLMLLLIFSVDDHEAGSGEAVCALTGEKCIYEKDKGNCYGCPVAEEAEKIGNR